MGAQGSKDDGPQQVATLCAFVIRVFGSLSLRVCASFFQSVIFLPLPVLVCVARVLCPPHRR